MYLRCALVSSFFLHCSVARRVLHSFLTRRSSDLLLKDRVFDIRAFLESIERVAAGGVAIDPDVVSQVLVRSEEHTSELQSRGHLVCRLLLEKKKTSSHLEKLRLTSN